MGQKSPFAKSNQGQQNNPNTSIPQQKSPFAKANQKQSGWDKTNNLIGEFNSAVPGFDELSALGSVGYMSASNMLRGVKNAPSFKQNWQTVRNQQQEGSRKINESNPKAAAFAKGVGYAAPMLIPVAGEANAARLAGQVESAAGRQATKNIVQYGAKKAVQKQALIAAPNATKALTTTKVAQKVLPKITSKVASNPVVRGAATASSQATVNAFADKGNLNERIVAANEAATNPLTLALGGFLGGATGRMPKIPKKIDSKTATLINAGVPLTYGQYYGGAVKNLEDKATSLPIIGTGISNARQRGLEVNRQAVFNNDLMKIGQELPANIQNGNEAMQYARNALNDEYARVLGGVQLRPTPQLRENIANVLNKSDFATDAAKSQAQNILSDRVTSRINDASQISGQEFQDIVSSLRSKGSQYGKSLDPVQQDVGQIVGDVRRALINEAAAQNPNFGQDYGNVSAAYKGFTQTRKAAGGQGVIDGNFTPKQYLAAVRGSDESVGRGNYARGQAFNQDYANAAASILPNQVNNSGTADRMFTGGLGVLALTKPAVGVPTIMGAGVGRLAYSEPAMNMFNKYIANKLSQEEARQLQYELQSNPEFRATWDSLSQRLSRGVGAQQGQRQ